MVTVDEARANPSLAFREAIAERERIITRNAAENHKLDIEISYLRALLFEASTVELGGWEQVPPDQWEHLAVDQTIRLMILRRPETGEKSWFGESVVTNLSGGWTRGIVLHGSHFEFFNGREPVKVTKKNVELMIWKKV